MALGITLLRIKTLYVMALHNNTGRYVTQNNDTQHKHPNDVTEAGPVW
jgi:hypothetical protein